ncbi:MAG: class I SAM-dependent methyltransferase [Chloroflexota bacterium]
MKCCNQCEGLENFFDKRSAENDLADYQRKGPTKQTRLLLNVLREVGVKGRTLLDIGGGIGAIQHELMKSGLGASTDVDASSSYLAVAREEAARQGYADRAHYLHGNFIDLAPQIEGADIVTLDRVICCFPDMQAMVSLSAARAKQFYALVYPRDSWWTRLGGQAGNVMLTLQRNQFRFFVHPAQQVDALVRAAGLQPKFQRNAGLIWQVVVYSR